MKLFNYKLLIQEVDKFSKIELLKKVTLVLCCICVLLCGCVTEPLWIGNP